MKTMTLRDEVAQLIFISFHGAAPNSRSREYRKFMRQIRDTKVGGLVLVNWSNGRVIQKAEPYALAAFLNRMQRLARTPLMVSGDFERGASMRVDGTTVFPTPWRSAPPAIPLLTLRRRGHRARGARAGRPMGFLSGGRRQQQPRQSHHQHPLLRRESEAVAAQVKAFIEGAHADKKNYVLTTVKHFPGHGDTAVDTHMNMPTIPADRERLDRVELVPFKAAIDAGVDSVMTAHIAVPALAPPGIPVHALRGDPDRPAEEGLGFKGIVVTDALEMGGIVKGFSTGEAAVRALEAGADVLLMPTDPDAAVKAVMAAVQSGRLTRQRIQESVVKVLAAKERVGLDRKRFVDLEGIGDVVDSPEANEKAQEIADHAVTLVRNNGAMIPLAAPDKACYVVMPESRTSSEGQAFSQEVRRIAPRAPVNTWDPTFSRQQLDEAVGRLAGCESYVVAAFASVGAYRGTVGMLGGELPHALEALIASGKPVALIALGNPYVLRNFGKVTAYLATFSNVAPSEIAAARAVLGEIDITGHLPVTIPGQAAYGEGIQLQATRAIPANRVPVR